MGGGARARHDLDRPPRVPRVRAERSDEGERAVRPRDQRVLRSTRGSWLEGAGAVWAENQALRWIADLAGMPASAGGVFVAGGTAGNLSALVTARHAAGARSDGRPARWRLAASGSAHSSVASRGARDGRRRPGGPADERGRLTGPALAATLEADGGDGVFAVVASAGATNAGTVDDLAGVADVCEEHGIWFHVDGAYGAAGLLADAVRPPVRGRRARRLIHRRPSQVAVRTVRRVRAPVPRPRDRPGGARPARLLPGVDHRHAGVEPERLRASPHPPGPRAPVVVLAGDLRHRGLPRRGRVDPDADARDGRGDPPPAGAGAADGSGAVGRAVPPAWAGRPRTTRPGGGACWRRRSRSSSRRRGRARRSPACAS